MGDHPPYHPAEAKKGRDEERAACFQGGKLKGITRRLDYIKGLGCTTVWVGPPFKQRKDDDCSGHGYAMQNFLDIDPRFGTIEDLQELTREAHKRGMYVVLDIVINHTGDNWLYQQENTPFLEDGRYEFGAWKKCGGGTISIEEAMAGKLGPDDGVWPLELQDPDVYARRGYIRDFNSAQLEEKLHGDFFSLKDMDLNNPKALDTMIRIFKYWIAVADVDGYRMDTVTHTEPGATSNFCNAIHEFAKSIGKHNFFLFAEIVESDEQLKKYVGHNTPVEGAWEEYPKFDAVLDFPLYFVLEEVIKGFTSPQQLRDRYESFRNYYRDFSEAGEYYVTFVDNHDQMARPYRRFMNNVEDPKQAIIAMGYLLTNMGVPCIYYGTEQGFDGGGTTDTFVRENMFGGNWGAFDTTGVHFFNPKHEIYKGIAAIAEVRRKEPALRYGRQYFREISGNGKDFGHPIDGQCTLAYSRVLDTTSIVVAMNLTDKAREDYVQVDGNLNVQGGSMVNLLNQSDVVKIETDETGRVFFRTKLDAHVMGIYKHT